LKRAIDKLRDAIREERYMISVHANEEMSNDELMAIDVENAILTGKIAKRFTKDPRGARYEVVGKACDVVQSQLSVGLWEQHGLE